MELTANGVRLHDEVSGQGPAVVLRAGVALTNFVMGKSPGHAAGGA